MELIAGIKAVLCNFEDQKYTVYSHNHSMVLDMRSVESHLTNTVPSAGQKLSVTFLLSPGRGLIARHYASDPLYGTQIEGAEVG